MTKSGNLRQKTAMENRKGPSSRLALWLVPSPRYFAKLTSYCNGVEETVAAAPVGSKRITPD